MNTAQLTTQSSTFDPVDAAVAAVERVLSMAAVPTETWGDSGAAVLASLMPSGYAVAILASLEPTGKIRHTEFIGVAQGGYRSRAERVGTTGENSGGQVEQLRIRAGATGSLGFVVEDTTLARPWATPVSMLPAARNWGVGPLGKLWAGVDAREVFIGSAPVGTYEPGRALIVSLCATAQIDNPASTAHVISAVLAALARRALLAFGPLRSSSTQWLTAREFEILDRLALGMTVKQISADVDRSVFTIADHIKSLHRKLNATTRGELVARALGHIDHCPGIRDLKPAKGGADT